MRRSASIRWRWTGSIAFSAAVHAATIAALPAPGPPGPPEDDLGALVVELQHIPVPPAPKAADDDAAADAGDEQTDGHHATGDGEGTGEGEGDDGIGTASGEGEAEPDDSALVVTRTAPDPHGNGAGGEGLPDGESASTEAPVEPEVPEPGPARDGASAAAEADAAATTAGAEAERTDLDGSEDDAVAIAEIAAPMRGDEATDDGDSADEPGHTEASTPPPPAEAPELAPAEAEQPAAAAEEEQRAPEKGRGDAMVEEPEAEPPKPKKQQEDVRQASKREKKEKRERKEEEAAPETPLEELEWLPFVWTDAAEGGPSAEAEAIAAHDVSADERVRPEVTDEVSGPRMDGVASKVLGVPTPVQATPDEVARRASGDPEATRDPTEAERTTAEAAAAPTTTTATEATVQAAAPQASAAPAEAAVAAVSVPLGGAPAAPLPPRDAGSATPVETSEVPEVLVPDWWEPASLRVTGAPPIPAQTPSTMGAPTPTVAAVASADRPVLAATEGGEAGQQVPGTQVAAGAAAGEQVARVREAQQDVDEPAIASGHPNPNRPTEPFAPSRSPLASFDEAEDVETPLVSAIATPLGAWIREIDLLIRERWRTGELGIADGAFYLGGDVVVQFLVSRTGRVEEVEVVQGSGVAALDAMARMAVPEKLPRPPEGPVAHKVTFKYRSR